MNITDSPASFLEGHPAHVKMIGMITVELANLEIELADLLAALINRDRDIGHALYFTPKSTIARLEMIDSVASILLNPGPLLSEISKNTKKARRVMDKRHRLIHAAWGVSSDNSKVLHSSLPLGEGKAEQTRVGDLAAVVQQLREVTENVSTVLDKVQDVIWRR